MARPRTHLPRFIHETDGTFFEKPIQKVLSTRHTLPDLYLPSEFRDRFDPIAWPIYCYDAVGHYIIPTTNELAVAARFTSAYKSDPEFVGALLLACQKVQDSKCDEEDRKTWTQEKWIVEYENWTIYPFPSNQLRRARLGTLPDFSLKNYLATHTVRDMDWKELAVVINQERAAIGLKPPYADGEFRKTFSEIKQHREAVLKKWSKHIEAFLVS